MKLKLGLLIFLLAATVARRRPTTSPLCCNRDCLRNRPTATSTRPSRITRSLAAQFDKDRQLAATAVFRLGECYRAQGKTNEAAAQYQRILRDFSDQNTLATLSRQDLTGMGMAASQPRFGAQSISPEAQVLEMEQLSTSCSQHTFISRGRDLTSTRGQLVP